MIFDNLLALMPLTNSFLEQWLARINNNSLLANSGWDMRSKIINTRFEGFESHKLFRLADGGSGWQCCLKTSTKSPTNQTTQQPSIFLTLRTADYLTFAACYSALCLATAVVRVSPTVSSPMAPASPQWPFLGCSPGGIRCFPC